MRVLVVYESMYGNTRAIAEAITDGVRTGLSAALRPVASVTADDLAEADLVIIGAPTHVHSMPRPMSRKAAVKAASSNEALSLEPGAAGPGIREWLRTVGDGAGKRAAVFDTLRRGTGARGLTAVAKSAEPPAKTLHPSPRLRSPPAPSGRQRRRRPAGPVRRPAPWHRVFGL